MQLAEFAYADAADYDLMYWVAAEEPAALPELTLIIVMRRCVVEDLAELMMAEAAEGCRLQDHQPAGRG